MPLGDLTSRLTFDGSGFERGANRAKAKVNELDRTFKTVGGNIRSGFLTVFGIETARRIARNISQQVEEIQKLAKEYNLTTSEVQALQVEADRLGVPFKELAEDAERIADAMARAAKNPIIIQFDKDTIEAVQFLEKLVSASGRTLTGLVAGQMGGAVRAGKTAAQAGIKLAEGDVGGGITTAKVAALTAAVPVLSRFINKFALAAEDAEIERGGPSGAAQSGFTIGKDPAIAIRKKAAADIAGLGLNIQSDSLRSVGNFLGGSTDTRQLWEDINRKMDRIIALAERNVAEAHSNPFPQ